MSEELDKEIDDAFRIMFQFWVSDPDKPIFGDNARDRTIRALRYLAISNNRGETASRLIEASHDPEALARWRTMPIIQDPYAKNLNNYIKKQRKEKDKLKCVVKDITKAVESLKYHRQTGHYDVGYNDALENVSDIIEGIMNE